MDTLTLPRPMFFTVEGDEVFSDAEKKLLVVSHAICKDLLKGTTFFTKNTKTTYSSYSAESNRSRRGTVCQILF